MSTQPQKNNSRPFLGAFGKTSLAAVIMGVLATPAIADDIHVAASIRPLHSLVEMVLGDQGEAVLLADGNMSPHNITLRPSDRLQLAKADLVFLIDDNFAPILAKTVADPSRKVLMAEADGLIKHKRRTSEYFGHGDHGHDDHDDHGHDDHGHNDHGHNDHDDHDDHGHDDHGHDDHGHNDHDDHDDHGHDDNGHDDHGHDDHGHDDHGHNDHDDHDDHGHDDHGHNDHDDHDDHGHDDHGHSHAYGEFDLHFWLDAKNAMAMVNLIESRLSARYPNHADAFAQNKEQALKNLQALDANISDQVKPFKNLGLIVYHDAYTYFEEAYGLNVKTTVLDHHDASSGVNRIQMIRHLVDHGEVSCLAHEPQFNAKILTTIDPGQKLTRIEMDPIGVAYPAGAGQYGEMMQGLVNSLMQCR